MTVKLESLSPRALRGLCRSGEFGGATSGIAKGYVQANLMIVPGEIGCSFSFESALMESGIPLRHVEQRRNVAMYKTSIPCRPTGIFQGNMVVSMRPVKSRDIARAVEISGKFPQVHGAPVHVGHSQAIGIADLSQPDFGDAVDILEDELPVFWACGVTPQHVAQLSRIPFCITHSPGKMLVTDLTNG